MSEKNWKPGDVAHVAVGGGGTVAIWTGEFWAWVPTDHMGPYDGVAHCHSDVKARPLVVIDPESAEDAKRLDEAYRRALDTAPKFHSLADVMQAALREFANPKPPRCESVLNVKGEHFQCQLDADRHDHLAHSNSDAEAIWGAAQ